MVALTRTILLLMLLIVITGSGVTAAPPSTSGAKDYAYLYLQGKISDPVAGRPQAGALVRLRGSGEVFEATTDQRGSFVFDKLPVHAYTVEVIAADGRKMRNLRDIDPDDPFPDRARVRIHFGDGAAQNLRIETTDQQVNVLVPEPRTRWGRLWKQLAIFIGAAGLLAL